MKALLISSVALASLALASLATAADRKLGKELSAGEPMTLSALLDSPEGYVGKTVQVSGKVTEVCEAMGCWMDLADDRGHLMHIEVEDMGSVVFPKDSVGKEAVVEGLLEKKVMTREQVIAAEREKAADAHRKFDAKRIKAGKTVYQISGLGAVIRDAQ